MSKGIRTEEQLKKDGWKLASLTGGVHLERTLDMYHELGIETYLFKVDPDTCESCTKCFVQNGETQYRIYIRQRG